MHEKDGEDQLDWSFEKSRRITTAKEEINLLHTMEKRSKINLIFHIFRRNCILKHNIYRSIG
jgi:hypothetical protein